MSLNWVISGAKIDFTEELGILNPDCRFRFIKYYVIFSSKTEFER